MNTSTGQPASTDTEHSFTRSVTAPAVAPLDDQQQWPMAVQQVLVTLTVLFTLVISGWLSPIDIDGYMFWPVTGFAIAALRYRPPLFFGLALGLWLWGVLGPLGLWFGTLNLLPLAGPLIYQRIHARWPYPASVPAHRLVSLGRIVAFSLLPSAIIGTGLLVYTNVEMDYILAAMLVYLLSDFAGTVIFLPVVSHWLNRKQTVAWRPIVLFSAIVILPLLLAQVGLGAYSQVSLFLVLPGLLWLAQTVNRPTLSHALLVVFITHLTMAYFGLGGYTPLNQMAQMASLALLLLAVFVTVDTLQAMRVDRDFALRRAERLAEQDHRAPALNERGLMQWSATVADLTLQSGVIYKPVNSHIYLRTLSWEQLGRMEVQLINTLQALLPAAKIAKLSDLTMVAVVPSQQMDKRCLLELLQIEIKLSQTHFITDGAVAAFQHLSPDMAESLAKLNLLWSMAVEQPNIRLRHEDSGQAVASRQGMIGAFQRFRTAVETDGLDLWLQPIRALKSGLTTKAEVLARLRIPAQDGFTLANPGEFLPVFQMFNYLTEFDRHVLEQTFCQFDRMRRSLGDTGTLNVNITGATLSDDELVAWLSDRVATHQVDPQLMCIEITETDRVQDRAAAIANIKGMRALGFQVAIDDFGTGLASFEYLNDFPVNVLKLDGQFISDIADNPRHQAIVRAMVEVAESYDLELVGEFVDNEPALLCLKALGVHYAQGYFIGKPSDDWR